LSVRLITAASECPAGSSTCANSWATTVLAERTRSSREIHDTLLHSVGALALQLALVSRHLRDDEGEARKVMQRLRRHVAACIRDARHSVWALRSLRLEHRNLSEALEEMPQETMVALPVAARVVVDGRERHCRPDS
jgi:signal transduction histidine kinase